MNDLSKILHEYVVYIYYLTQTESGFETFKIDFSEPETGSYFIKGFIEWCKLNYNIEANYLEALQVYVNHSKYNSFGENKFEITKEIMEKIFEIGLINKVEYNRNNETIVRSEIKRKTSKKGKNKGIK